MLIRRGRLMTWLELDQNQHKTYDAEEEMTRIERGMAEFCFPVHLIRAVPGAVDRMDDLLRLVQDYSYLERAEEHGGIYVTFLGYAPERVAALIAVAKARGWDVTMMFPHEQLLPMRQQKRREHTVKFCHS